LLQNQAFYTTDDYINNELIGSTSQRLETVAYLHIYRNTPATSADKHSYIDKSSSTYTTYMYHKIIKQSDVIKWSKNLMNLLMKIITVNIYTFK